MKEKKAKNELFGTEISPFLGGIIAVIVCTIGFVFYPLLVIIDLLLKWGGRNGFFHEETEEQIDDGVLRKTINRSTIITADSFRHRKRK